LTSNGDHSRYNPPLKKRKDKSFAGFSSSFTHLATLFGNTAKFRRKATLLNKNQ